MDCLVGCCVATALAGCGIVGKDCSLGLGVSFRLFGELLFFACPKRRLFYDRSVSPLGDRSFLCLSIRKKAKNKTPQLPLLSCATRIAGRPSKLALTSHTRRGLLRSSDSRWSKTPVNPALLGAADGDPEHHATATISELKKKESVFEPSTFMQCEFGEINPIPSR